MPYYLADTPKLYLLLCSAIIFAFLCTTLVYMTLKWFFFWKLNSTVKLVHKGQLLYNQFLHSLCVTPAAVMLEEAVNNFVNLDLADTNYVQERKTQKAWEKNELSGEIEKLWKVKALVLVWLANKVNSHNRTKKHTKLYRLHASKSIEPVRQLFIMVLHSNLSRCIRTFAQKRHYYSIKRKKGNIQKFFFLQGVYFPLNILSLDFSDTEV